MDELNVHQFWGISPFIDLLAAAAAAGQHAEQQVHNDVMSFLQVCPYDCRHTLATISSHACSVSQQEYAAASPEAPATPTAADRDNTNTQQPQQPSSVLFADQSAGQQQQQQQQQQQANFYECQHHQQQSQQKQQKLQLFIYESEPEVLVRHMLLLVLLFDDSLPVRERAELFMELHGNVMLRQRTAEYLVTISKQLEHAVSQLSLCASPAAAAAAAAAPINSSSSSSSKGLCQQQQQHQKSLGALAAFDLSLLRYQDRDALLETFQRYRQKAGFNVSKAWDDRCRKWYGDRYDFRTNMVDWDYHMRLSPRGSPFMDPSVGSIVHFYHFRHWRLTGVAHELRGSSYTATNSSLLSTAYGRTREFKDRQLRDVGRSVSAFSYWGDILNSPYHAFGTVADDPQLFSIANKQFTHTAVDVAEHNILGFLSKLRAGSQAAAAADVAHITAKEAHRANAARGPTSMEKLAAAAAGSQTQQQQQQEEEAEVPAEHVANLKQQHQENQEVGHNQQQKQATGQNTVSSDELEQLAALEAAITAASINRLVASTKICLLCGDLKRSLTSKAKFAGSFAAATVGHRHVHMLGPEHGLAAVMQPGAPVIVESGLNMVQLNTEQVMAFEEKVVEMAAAGGFGRHPVLGQQQQQQQQQQHSKQQNKQQLVGGEGGQEKRKGQQQQQQQQSKQEGQQQQQQQQQQEGQQGHAGSAEQSGRAANAGKVGAAVAGWRLPPGHFALASG